MIVPEKPTPSYADEINSSWAEIKNILGLNDKGRGKYVPEHVVILAICRKLQLLEKAVINQDRVLFDGHS